ncbi:hypothetical protein CRG98_008438 [Punica granatum]|uniref:Reverse transcriptase Ty1/copia-type domain-containing protein n=1 Tax=Punica granatum TaxID=22663 RepID=A0A2I0KS29_PUNGR|nr:hypothetical protein CRG98_008438 [Punica granatum]
MSFLAIPHITWDIDASILSVTVSSYLLRLFFKSALSRSELVRLSQWNLEGHPRTLLLLQVYRIKQKADGKIDHYKARLAAKGFNQREGFDYKETFHPVIKLVAIRTILSIDIFMQWPIRQLDAKNAFLHGHLSEEVYMSQPPEFINPSRPNHPRRRSPPSSAPSCADVAAPSGGNRRSQPSEPSSPPIFVFSGILLLTGSTHLFGLCRSSPADSAQLALPSPAETIRPVPPRLEFSPERATRFARRFGPAPAPGPARPFSWPSASFRDPTPARSAQPMSAAQTSARSAELAGPAPPRSRSALFRPPSPI